jgi:hypothetical protein
VFQGAALNQPATVHFGLLADYSDTLPGSVARHNLTEVAGGTYARVGVTNNLTNFPGAANRVKTMAANVTINADPGTVVKGFALYPDGSDPIPMAYGFLQAPVTVPAAGNLILRASEFRLSITGMPNATAHPILDALLGGATPSWPSSFHLALLRSMPADDGTGLSEASGTGYIRQALGRTSGNWRIQSYIRGQRPARAAYQVTGIIGIGPATALLTYPKVGASWGNIGALGLYSAASGGNFHWGADLGTVTPVAQGDDVSIPIGMRDDNAFDTGLVFNLNLD